MSENHPDTTPHTDQAETPLDQAAAQSPVDDNATPGNGTEAGGTGGGG